MLHNQEAISGIRFKLRLFIFIYSISVGLMGCGNSRLLSEELKSEPGKFFVMVFDCKVAIPVEYVLNSYDTSRFSFVRVGDKTGSINIDIYDDSIVDSDSITILEKKSFGELTVLFVDVIRGFDKPRSVTLLHNKRQVVSIIGDDQYLWERIVQSCNETKDQ